MPDVSVILQEDMVLCKIYRKATPLKELEQRASAMEEMQRRSNAHFAARAPLVQAAPSPCDEYLSSEDVHDSFLFPSSSSSAPSSDSYGAPMEAKQEAADTATVTVASSSSSLMQAANMAIMPPPPVPVRHGDLPTLQVPTNHGALDWMQDLSQLRSPWQDQLFLSPLVQAHLLY